MALLLHRSRPPPLNLAQLPVDASSFSRRLGSCSKRMLSKVRRWECAGGKHSGGEGACQFEKDNKKQQVFFFSLDGSSAFFFQLASSALGAPRALAPPTPVDSKKARRKRTGEHFGARR